MIMLYAYSLVLPGPVREKEGLAGTARVPRLRAHSLPPRLPEIEIACVDPRQPRFRAGDILGPSLKKDVEGSWAPESFRHKS
jgi:hypothetical protein